MSTEAEREQLRLEYLRLTREVLPTRARREGWVVTEDHCFGRILLDNAAGDAWRNVLRDRRPGYAQLSDAQLAEAVRLGREVETRGDPFLRDLNARSLAWRGKLGSDRRRGGV